MKTIRGKRFMLGTDERKILLTALQAYIYRRLHPEISVVIKDEQFPEADWTEAQAAFRVAEAIAMPKRGMRAHAVKGYDWYFKNDPVAPLSIIDGWIAGLSSGGNANSGQSA